MLFSSQVLSHHYFPTPLRVCFAVSLQLLVFRGRTLSQDIELSVSSVADRSTSHQAVKYVGPAESAPSFIRSIDVFGDRCTEAVAGPWYAKSHTAAISTGAFSQNRPSSLASFEWNIEFENNQALRDLVPAGQDGFDFNVHFRVEIESSAPEVIPRAGLFGLSMLDIGVSVHSGERASGEHTIINEESEHRFENNGVLTGLPEHGGEATFAVAHRISPGRSDFGTEISGEVGTKVFSFNPLGAFGDVSLSLVDGPSAFTLLDGTPLVDLGLVYDLGRDPMSPPGSLCGLPGEPAWDIARLTIQGDVSVAEVSAFAFGPGTLVTLAPEENDLDGIEAVAEIEAVIPAGIVDGGADSLTFAGPDSNGNLILSFPIGTVSGTPDFQTLFTGWTVSDALADLGGFLSDPVVQALVGSPVPPMGGSPTPMEVFVFDSSTEDFTLVGGGTIAAIPEPSTLALTVAGFSVIGAFGILRQARVIGLPNLRT